MESKVGLARGELAHESSSVRVRGEQRFLFEVPYRLSQRATTDTDLLRTLNLVQTLAQNKATSTIASQPDSTKPGESV